MTSRRQSGVGSGAPGGFGLIEVIAAVAVLSITVVPLFAVFLSLNGRALALSDELVRSAQAGAKMDAAGGSERAPWEWSLSVASVEDASWSADGLRVRLRLPATKRQLELGWWVDGWRGGTMIVDPAVSQAELVLADLRAADAQAEVVVRLREPEGPWGVPWRTARDPLVPPSDRAGSGQGGVGGFPGDRTVAIVHDRAAGLSSLVPTPATAEMPADTYACPVAFLSEAGWVGMECDGRTQTLWASPSELAHLYF